MFALAFLNPLLLWAVPLCSVPILIHLLNRRRFHKVPWAAMEFLLAAMKRNRKRLRMEQWLVLLLRTLAVLLLVFLVSRPQLGGGGLLGARTHHVVVLDDSASMTQRSGSSNLFERAQDRVRTLLDELATTRSGDLFSLVRTSRPATPELWAVRVGPELGQRVGSLLKELVVGDTAPDLGAVLQATGKRAAEQQDAARTHLYVVGDQRAHDWATEDDKPRPALLAALAALRADQDHVSVLGGGGPPANLAVVDVRLLDRLVIAGVPATLVVDVHNFGLDPTPATTVAIEVDGQSRVVQPVPPLAPGERVAIPAGHTFHQAGAHRVEAALAATEFFPLDDRRTLALDVRDKSRVLLVDGQPDEELGETFYLQAAMELPESGLEPMVVTDAALEETELQPFDLIWLCNVQSVSTATAARVEAFVAAGGGLVVASGAQLDATRANELFWRDGKGVLPMAFGEIAGDPDKPVKAALVRPEHPVCHGIAEVFDLLISNVVLVKRWTTLVEEPGSDAAVVVRIRDAEGPPLLVTKTFGNGGGEVVQLAITADAFWSNLPSTDLFLVLAHQLHRCSSRRQDLASNNLLTDGSYRGELPAVTYRPDVTVRALAGDDERTFTAVEPAPVAGPTPAVPGSPQPAVPPGTAPAAIPAVPASPTVTVPMSELRQLGAYELELARHDGVPEKRLLSRSAPLAESRLVPFADGAFARLYPAELHQRVTFVRDGVVAGTGSGAGELWQLLAGLLLVGLIAESLLAWRFGRR